MARPWYYGFSGEALDKALLGGGSQNKDQGGFGHTTGFSKKGLFKDNSDLGGGRLKPQTHHE